MFKSADKTAQQLMISACYMPLREFRNQFYHKWKLAKAAVANGSSSSSSSE